MILERILFVVGAWCVGYLIGKSFGKTEEYKRRNAKIVAWALGAVVLAGGFFIK